MKKPIQVEIGNLFAGHTMAGVSFIEWQAMQPAEKLIRRMTFIRDEAAQLGNAIYDENCEMPGNMIAEAQNLHRMASLAVEVAERGDYADAALRALDVGAQMEGLNRSLAIWRALELKGDIHRPRARGGDAAAITKKNQEAENIRKVAHIWSQLAISDKPEHERANLISQRTGMNPDTVRRYIRKAGLR